MQPNYNQLLNQARTASPTQASVAENRKDKSVLVKRKLDSSTDSGSDSPTKKLVTNNLDTIKMPIPNTESPILHRPIPLIPQTSQAPNAAYTANLVKNLSQVYQLLQLNALLKNKNLNLGPSQNQSNLQSSTAFQKGGFKPRGGMDIKIDDQLGDRGEPSTMPGTARSYFSGRSRKSDTGKHTYGQYESDGDSENLSESNEPRPPITEPALVEFTKDFPEWGLADIFTFLTTGQPKKDITPVRRSSRPVLKGSSQELEKSSLTQEEESQMVGECREEIKDLLGMDDVNESKIKLMLKKNEMKVDRVIGTVKKNLPFYKKYFTTKK